MSERFEFTWCHNFWGVTMPSRMRERRFSMRSVQVCKCLWASSRYWKDADYQRHSQRLTMPSRMRERRFSMRSVQVCKFLWASSRYWKDADYRRQGVFGFLVEHSKGSSCIIRWFWASCSQIVLPCNLVARVLCCYQQGAPFTTSAADSHRDYHKSCINDKNSTLTAKLLYSSFWSTGNRAYMTWGSMSLASFTVSWLCVRLALTCLLMILKTLSS